MWLAMNEIVNTSGGNELSASGASGLNLPNRINDLRVIPNKNQPSLKEKVDETEAITARR